MDTGVSRGASRGGGLTDFASYTVVDCRVFPVAAAPAPACLERTITSRHVSTVILSFPHLSENSSFHAAVPFPRLPVVPVK